jgi:hypothetical protein
MEKGAQLLFDVAQEAQGGRVPLHFTVLGHTAVDGRLSKLENVSISGRYEENLLQALMQEVNPDLIWFPGMLPETYSFTLNAVIEAEIYPALAFDIGAVGHRITSEKLGWTVPLDHGLDTMQTLRDLNYFSSGTRVRAWLSSRSSILR